jgi:hypothetical protein
LFGTVSSKLKLSIYLGSFARLCSLLVFLYLRMPFLGVPVDETTVPPPPPPVAALHVATDIFMDEKRVVVCVSIDVYTTWLGKWKCN